MYSSPVTRLRAAQQRAILSDHSNQDEKRDLGQESDAGDRDRKEHVAHRENVHECLAVRNQKRKLLPGVVMSALPPRADVVSVPDRKNKGRTAGSVREGMERLDMSEKNGPSLGDGTGA